MSDSFISKAFPVSSGFSLETSRWLLWYGLISGDQPVFSEFSWSSGFCSLWTFGVVSRVLFFSSSSFEGLGFLLPTGPWFWPLLLEFVLGWSYVACSGLTVPVSDVVHRVCFGVLCSRSSFWFLAHCGKFLRGLALLAQVCLDSYSEGDLPPCCGCLTTGALR